MTPVRILKIFNIRFGIIVWPTSWSFWCLPPNVLHNRFFVSAVLLHAATIVCWFAKCLSALGPHVFHMKLFSNALSLLSYTEAREEYPLDVGDDSARSFFFPACLFTYILPGVRILCQMTHITCCLRRLSRDCHCVIPVNCKQPERNVRVWEMWREFIHGTSFCSLSVGVLEFYLYIFWNPKAYIFSIKASVSPRVFLFVCVRRTPNEAIWGKLTDRATCIKGARVVAVGRRYCDRLRQLHMHIETFWYVR